eukprot:s917_g25.t1
MNVSAYAFPYTSTFGLVVARVILKECWLREPPVVLFQEPPHDVFAMKHESSDLAPEESQSQKRRRYGIKGPPQGPDACAPGSSNPVTYGKAPTWEDLIKRVSKDLPRVGNFVIKPEDPVCREFQMMVPELQVKLVLLCRGTERFRVPGAMANNQSMSWRKTVIVSRDSGRVVDLGPPENWQSLSKLKQTRKAGSARISVTIFGDKTESSCEARPSVPASVENVLPPVEAIRDDGNPPETADSSMPDVGREPNVKVPISNMDGDTDEHPEVRNGEHAVHEGWAPKSIPQSGPSFNALEQHQKNDLKRLHSNLGHPSPERLCRLLTEQGADEHVIRAARDYQCDVCVENRHGPKLPSPATIHEHKDFNDVVGCDGAYWKSGNGVTYHFLHFIDEATMFHLGALSGRTVEEQIMTFENVWLQWAGPCKILYLDPAGEYINDRWHTHLQRENIKVSMSAGDSHWQLGRSESHGKIIKAMLTAMDLENPIDSVDEFSRCLRQAFAAKNSMGQTRGFSPEQALLGKARSLPGSLMSDEQTSAHSLLDADTPDGMRFREDLARRERARRAFISADNDKSIRRALLRRPRIANFSFEKGDWVLYWRRHKGNLKGDRGRWYGPGQVVVCENKKVIWISHGGYLIRASPQQLRPASMREFKTLDRDKDGRVRDIGISPQCKNFVDLGDDNPENNETPVESSPVAAVPSAPISIATSQPDGEIFPPDLGTESYTPTSPAKTDDHGVGDGDEQIEGQEEREKEAYEIPVPDDDQDAFFGDDVSWDSGEPGFWEIEFCDGPQIDVGVDGESLFCENPEIGEWLLLATEPRKQKAYSMVNNVVCWVAHTAGQTPQFCGTCLFSLVTKDHQGRPRVRGCVGLHVDDGIGGGDSYFREVIGKLRQKFEFGAYNEGEFEFCGVRYFQWDDGSIEMSQDSYIQKISPIEIPRYRRQQVQSSLTPTEVQQLRQICGSLQYSAVHTRPDLAAKVGELQSAVSAGRIEHLIAANRVLYEAKSHPVSLMIVPIEEHQVTFCAFSDASFETGLRS